MRSYEPALLYVFLACGCSAQQEEAYVAPPPPPPAYVPQPASSQSTPTQEASPLMPECKSLTEGCVTDDVSRLPIAKVATIGPPAGWSYAFTADQGIRLLAPEGGATIAFERVDGTNPEVVWPHLYALLTKLHVTGVVPEAITLARPQDQWQAQGLRLQVWQVEESQKIGGTTRSKDPAIDGEPGALLVGITQIDATNAVLGVGFLKRSAPKALVPSIRQIMESLSAQPQESAAPASGPTPLPVPATRP